MSQDPPSKGDLPKGPDVARAPPAPDEEAKARQLALTKAQEKLAGEGYARLNLPSPLSVATTTSELFAGPLPPPNMLREYEKAHPGLGQTLIEACRSETEHRRGLEKADQNLAIEIARRQLANQSLGVRFAFILGLTGLLGAIALGITGHDVSAAVIAGIDIVGLAAVFITGTTRRHSRRTRDDQGNDD